MLTKPPLPSVSVPLMLVRDAPKSTPLKIETLTPVSKVSVLELLLVTLLSPPVMANVPVPVMVRVAGAAEPPTSMFVPATAPLSVRPLLLLPRSMPPALTICRALPPLGPVTITLVAGLLLNVRFPLALSTMR